MARISKTTKTPQRVGGCVKLTHTQLATLRMLAALGPTHYSREWVMRGRYSVTSAGWEHFWLYDLPLGASLNTMLALVKKGLVEADHEVLDVFDDGWSSPRLSKRSFAPGEASSEEYIFTVSPLGSDVLDDLADAVLPRKYGWWRQEH